MYVIQCKDLDLEKIQFCFLNLSQNPECVGDKVQAFGKRKTPKRFENDIKYDSFTLALKQKELQDFLKCKLKNFQNPKSSFPCPVLKAEKTVEKTTSLKQHNIE